MKAAIADVSPDAEVQKIPIADGGDGTIDAAVAAGFDRVPVSVHGPTGLPVETAYARRGALGVIEIAATCGLGLLPRNKAKPLSSSSFGFGEAVRAALDAGCSRIILGLGGSASTDGGAGMLVALGAQLVDGYDKPVELGGADLVRVARIDLSHMHPALSQTEIVIASDVSSPLLGVNGAAAIYGPQKGAVPDEVRRLELSLARWSQIVAKSVGKDDSNVPGSGAAGGVGYAALTFLGAHMSQGIDLMLELVGFNSALPMADLVVTGEGSLDVQTLSGKAPAGVAATARSLNVPTIAIAGRVLLTERQLIDAGFNYAYSLSDIEPNIEKSIANAVPLLYRASRAMARRWIVES
jgi:glycerate 2-kinase